MPSTDASLPSVLAVKKFPGSFPSVPIPGESIANLLNEGKISSVLAAASFPNTIPSPA